MGNCISSQEVNHSRYNARTPRIDIVEPENQEQAIQQFNRSSQLYLNQQRIQQPINTTTIYIIRPINIIELLNVVETENNNSANINKYNTYVYDNQTINSCCICLENFIQGEYITELPCNHLFHNKCISQWFNNNNKCPLCKLEC